MSKFSKEQLDEIMHDMECIAKAIRISAEHSLLVEVVMTMIMKAYEEGTRDSITPGAQVNYENICNCAVGEWIK
jgi:hypothetical protein